MNNLSDGPIKTVSAETMSEIDRRAREEFGIPEAVLMENAGKSVADFLLDQMDMKNEKVAILCGKGNNGGDGYVVAKHLKHACPIELAVFAVEPDKVKAGAARTNFEIALSEGVEVNEIDRIGESRKTLTGFTLIIDAVFGTGFRGDLSGDIRKIMRFFNDQSIKRVAVDIPSGLDSTTGAASADCLRADHTITFAFPKTGFYINDGPSVCGSIHVRDIGFPEALLKEYM